MELKDYAIPVVSVVVSVLVVGFIFSPEDGRPGRDGRNGSDGVGAIAGDELYNEFAALGGFRHTEKSVALAPTSVFSTTTLQFKDSGSTYYLSASGTTITLPAVTFDGANYRFVINGAADTGNYIIDSAEGDNINGTLEVNGADVACSGEDQLNFVVDGETIGDFVEVRSDGTQWLVGDSRIETAAKLTCTDPS